MSYTACITCTCSSTVWLHKKLKVKAFCVFSDSGSWILRMEIAVHAAIHHLTRSPRRRSVWIQHAGNTRRGSPLLLLVRCCIQTQTFSVITQSWTEVSHEEHRRKTRQCWIISCNLMSTDYKQSQNFASLKQSNWSNLAATYGPRTEGTIHLSIRTSRQRRKCTMMVVTPRRKHPMMPITQRSLGQLYVVYVGSDVVGYF